MQHYPGGFDFARFRREFGRSADDARKQLRAITSDTVAERAIRAARETVLSVGPALLRSVAVAAERFRSEFNRAMPTNWDPLTTPQIFDAVDMMARTGWSVVWTPPAETVIEILNAPDAEARRAVLLASEARIVEDLDDLLGNVETKSLLGLRDAARESLEAYRCGLFKASQALTTTTLSTTLHEQLRQRSHAKVRKQFLAADKEEALIRDFRWLAVQRAVAKVLEDYHPVTGLPERSDFNRNASAHRVKEPQYRQVNALSALMLLTSVLTELDELARLEAGPYTRNQGTDQRPLGAGPSGEPSSGGG